MKFCKDCEWVDGSGVSARCKAPKNRVVSFDPVTGHEAHEYRWDYCKTMREDGVLGSYVNRTCGKRARWFKPRSKP